MPSPCEVIEPPVIVEALAPPARRLPTRVFPAVVGGVFAGLLLVGLGCTPFFKPANANAAAEQPTIVQASASGDKAAVSAVDPLPTGKDDARRDFAKTRHDVSPGTSSVARSGDRSKATAATSTPGATRDADAGTSAHGFVIECDPQHAGASSGDARPERVLLQGIMSGPTTKAALLDGTLYREGDHFGSGVCPWTVAMIDAGSVRIEKTLGDRTCGVTIKFAPEKAQHGADK